MRNKRLIIALLAAITFGLIAAVSVKQYLLSAQAFNRTNDVVVAKIEIPVGSRIIPEQLAIAQFPADVTPVGAIGKVDLIWAWGDLMNGLQIFPNLVGVIGLSGIAAATLRPRVGPPPGPPVPEPARAWLMRQRVAAS